MVLNFDHGGMDEGQVKNEISALSNDVIIDPDQFEAWDKLVNYAEQLEGGPTRNSSPQAIAAYREIFDRLLEKFPLMFGYWKKYADREFHVAGPESAQMIYERGTASIPNSVDLWTAYCQFMMDVSHDVEQVQELFERATDTVGLDFHAHPFWDLYLEFQNRNSSIPNVKLQGEFQILSRIVHIPLYHYARYSHKYNDLATEQPVSALCPPDVYAQWRSEVTMDPAHANKSDEEIDREIRERIDRKNADVFKDVHAQVSERWAFEQHIKRGYFHVTEIDSAEIDNWEKYLAFEIQRGDYKRITVLFERCLVPTAYYEKFWLMYAHWLLTQPTKTEELRSVYARASCFFCAIARPQIRLEWALFEEKMGRHAVANEIYNAILDVLPGNTEVVKALCYATRRNKGAEEAIEVWKKQIAAHSVSAETRAGMIADLARFSSRVQEQADADHGTEGRLMFQAYLSTLDHTPDFWAGYLSFEIDQPAYPDKHKTVQEVFSQIRTNQNLNTETRKDLGEIYKAYLLERGPDNAAKEVMTLIHELDGFRGIVLYFLAAFEMSYGYYRWSDKATNHQDESGSYDVSLVPSSNDRIPLPSKPPIPFTWLGFGGGLPDFSHHKPTAPFHFPPREVTMPFMAADRFEDVHDHKKGAPGSSSKSQSPANRSDKEDDKDIGEPCGVEPSTSSDGTQLLPSSLGSDDPPQICATGTPARPLQMSDNPYSTFNYLPASMRRHLASVKRRGLDS